MSSGSSADIQQWWNHFLQEIELAKNHHMSALLNLFGGTFPNPLLDYMLPSLLYVKMVAILDQALIVFIRDRGLTVPENEYGHALHGRIKYLNDQSLLTNYAGLHGIRKLRNR